MGMVGLNRSLLIRIRSALTDRLARRDASAARLLGVGVCLSASALVACLHARVLDGLDEIAASLGARLEHVVADRRQDQQPEHEPCSPVLSSMRTSCGPHHAERPTA
jgi:hypothetical protein